MRKLRWAISALIVGLMLPLTTAVLAEGALVEPTGRVVLTVSGKIGATNSGDTAQFDMEMLRALPAQSFSTSTLWTEGVHEFTGVPLAVLLEELGISGGTVDAWAINDYLAEFDVARLEPDVPIIAYAMNGKPMPRRDKGPLWLVYPYDSSDRYRTELVYSRSVWQLDRLEILE
ncbi:molybdopterin-dependent oxidoreductase [Thiosulfatihalobacter marinus]|uniref:molybdopterin-dependent oxidoreductase n=1 Tax=Thiosulfatihalobacter marinus TaxID=2792481 RepID=UPI0018D92F61|nr:molybdopterin-dependent oxidoreductase [Thiosulfatihalobacter marinus]